MISASFFYYSDGSDYRGVSSRDFTFNTLTTSHYFNIPIINDDIHEDIEQFFGILTTNHDPSIVTLGPNRTTIRIDRKLLFGSCCIPSTATELLAFETPRHFVMHF